MHMKSAMLAAAAIFFVISPSISFYVAPSMKKLPSNLDEIIYYNGRLGMFNLSSLKMDYQDVHIKRHIKALEQHGNVLIIREDISIRDKNGKELKEFGMTKIYGINDRTAENVKGYGDLDRIGHWIFPVGIKKKNYVVWNSDLDDACKKGYISPSDAVATAYYIGEEVKNGVKTYKFYGSQSNLYVGNLPELPEVKMYYGGEITAWADVATGTIVDLHKHIKEYADFPDLHKIPSNLNQSICLKGKLKMLNQSNGKYNICNISLNNHIWVDNVTNSYYIISNEIYAKDENGNEIKELCAKSKDAVNPYTMQYLPILSDKKGLMSFPIGIKKKDYELWDPNIKDVVRAVYCSEKKFDDLTLYRYYQNVSNYYIGKQDIEGISDRFIKLYFDGSTEYLVEPTTGYIAYVEKNSKVIGDFPDLHTIPENLKEKIKMEGSLWIISQGKKNIEMVRDVRVKNVYWENGNKILLIEDNTTTYNKKSGEKINEACKKEYHGVYADTGEEAKNYGDMERSGLYSFIPGVEKKDYMMWNPEINAPSPVNFIREEDHEGIHTYLFETKEDRVLYDSTLNQVVRYLTDTKYWVESVTGVIIDMSKESVKKINPLEILLGLRGIFWIDAYKMNLRFSKETIKEAKEKALQFENLIKLSNKKAEVLNISLNSNFYDGIENAKKQKAMMEKLSGNKINVLDLYYQMDQKSINDITNKVKKASFLLLMIQIIIPLFLIIIAIGLVTISIKK